MYVCGCVSASVCVFVRVSGCGGGSEGDVLP